MLVKLFQNQRPGLHVAIPCLRIGKPGMGEAKLGSCTLWRELDRNHGFGAIGAPSPRHPGQFNQVIALKAEEATIMLMALGFAVWLKLVPRFKEKDGVDRDLHHHRAWRGEPAIKLFRPRAI